MPEPVLYYVKLYAILFPFILAIFYVIPAGAFYWFLFVRKSSREATQRIQQRKPAAKSIRREIRSSVRSMLIFTFLGLCMYEIWRLGYSKIYLDPFEYSGFYLVFSFFGILVFHDTYFYWLHRFMHWRPMYKHIHHLHHLSITPTPWAMYAFQPLEVLIQFGLFPIIIIIVPFHPVALGAYFIYNIIVNTGGHSGHELLPRWMDRHWLFKYYNRVIHHDLHHSTFHYNYGLYLNIWDRIMGTFKGDSEVDTQKE